MTAQFFRSLILFLILSSTFILQPADTPQPPVIENFLKWQNKQESDLISYTSRRRYLLRSAEKDQFSSAEVEMIYNKARGVSFKILEWKGAGGVYRFALQRALDSETTVMRPQNKAARVFSEENYEFELLGTEQCSGKACYSLRIKPRRKLTALLDGKIWIDAKSFGLVRVDGRTSASSFWAGQPLVAQEFVTVNGFQLLQKSDLRIKARGLGDTILNVEVLSQEVSPD